eukprot:s462_g17.t1
MSCQGSIDDEVSPEEWTEFAKYMKTSLIAAGLDADLRELTTLRGWLEASVPEAGSADGDAGQWAVPPDVTVMERAVLDLNQRDLWNGQNLDANSLLALRCLPEEQAMDLLGSLYSKGTGKGGVSIANPNNYLQAAIAKIVRTGGMSSGMNFTGNQTRQKAAELGLSLEDLTLKALARLPLRASVKLLESAAAAQMGGSDPNAVIIAEATMLEAQAQDNSRKRPRDAM